MQLLSFHYPSHKQRGKWFHVIDFLGNSQTHTNTEGDCVELGVGTCINMFLLDCCVGACNCYCGSYVFICNSQPYSNAYFGLVGKIVGVAFFIYKKMNSWKKESTLLKNGQKMEKKEINQEATKEIP